VHRDLFRKYFLYDIDSSIKNSYFKMKEDECKIQKIDKSNEVQTTSLLNNEYYKPTKDDEDNDDENFNWFNIISFALPGMPYYLMLTVIGVYANKFLLDEVKILPKNTSIILFASGAIDASIIEP
jgi:hypothetical protein